MNIFKPLTDLAYIVLIIMFVMIFFFVFGCFVFWFLKNLFKSAIDPAPLCNPFLFFSQINSACGGSF